LESTYKTDLDGLYRDGKNIFENVCVACEKIYSENKLSDKVEKSAFRSVDGDIYAKVLAKYLHKEVINLPEPHFEVPLKIGRIRADILYGDPANPLVIVEVKSHGQYATEENLRNRYERIKARYPNAIQIYVDFKETESCSRTTTKVLNELGVDTFFLSTYKTDNEEPKRHPDALERLVNKLK
jgi:hypothetical protein